MAGSAEAPLTVEPGADLWRGLLRPFPALSTEQRRFREQLGLATDRPVIMSGHQAQVWHPGILAKYFAADAAARALGAHAAWLVVDQDDNDCGLIRFPVRRADGHLRARVWNAAPPAPGTATALRPGFNPAPVAEPAAGEAFAAEPVGAGLERIYRALASHAGQSTAARQLTAALNDLMGPLVAPAPAIFATALSGTEFFRALVTKMAHDPGSCAGAYNKAAAGRPAAAIRTLGADGARGVELPLWDLQALGRRPVWSRDLADIPPARLAPRALLMTGLLRSGACDLFIHGTGGGGPEAGYEAVTDAWFTGWLGAPPPAPVTVVTATRRLPIAVAVHPGSPAQVAGALALAHRARHSPALIGDPNAGAKKREMVAEIEAARKSGADPLPLYRRMHAMLGTVRAAHAPELARLESLAAGAAARLADARILADRTWPFPLYPDAMLGGLKARIDAEFGL